MTTENFTKDLKELEPRPLAPRGLLQLPHFASRPELLHYYESLYSSLSLQNNSKPVQTLLVTSTQPEEGKTTIAIHLAATMSLKKKRVIVLDCDLRRPAVHRMTRTLRAPGIAEVLQGAAGVQKTIQLVGLDVGKADSDAAISIIPAGTTEIDLMHGDAGDHLRAAIDVLRDRYDVILIDSPPVLAVNDGLLLARYTDGVIFVVKAGHVSTEDACRAKARLEQAGGQVLGVALNCFDERWHGQGVHPYAGYYSTPNRKS